MVDDAVLVEYIKKDDCDVVEKLIRENPDPDRRFQSKRTMFHMAVSYNALKIATLLLNRGIDPNIADDEDIYPLHTLAISHNKGWDAIADLLVNCVRVEIDPRDKHGTTPLHFAVTLNKHSMVARLMRRGADPYVKDCEGRNSIDKANGVSAMLGIILSSSEIKIIQAITI